MTQRMHRTQIYLTDTQYHFLQEKAELKETSMADVVRNLIDKYLPNEKDFMSKPLFELDQKKFTMGTPGGSVSHDKYIYHSTKKRT